MNPFSEKGEGSHGEGAGRISGQGQGGRPLEKRLPQVGAGSPGRCGLPPGDKGGRSGSGPLAFFPSRHEQGPACRHSPGRPVRGRDNVAIVRAPQTGRAGRWEGRGAAGARALGAQRGPRTRTRSPRPGHAASRRPPGQPSAGQKLEGGWERKGGEEGERKKKMPKERGDGRGGEGGKERKDRREERRKTQGGEGRGGREGAREKKGGKKEGKKTKRAEKKGDGGVGETDRETDRQMCSLPRKPLQRAKVHPVPWREAAPNPAESAKHNHTRGFA